MISVIVPTLDEAPGIAAHLRHLDAALDPGDEVLLVDAGSRDGTADVARGLGLARLRVLDAPRGRARQLNAGGRAARGDWLLFLHADTRIDRAALDALRAAREAWGYFRLRLDAPGLAFRAVERGINARSRAFDTPSGDQAIFVRAATFAAVGGFPDVPLMEDLRLADALRALGPPARPPCAVTTSARRWRTRGVVRTVLRMWTLRLAFRAGVSPARLAPWY